MKKYKKYPLYQHTSNISNLKQLVDYCKSQYSDKPAFIYTENKQRYEVSYNQFRSDIDAIGAYLYKNGHKNFHIALLGENSYAWIAVYFSLVCGNNIVVPIDKDLSVNEIRTILAKSNCTVLFYDNKYSNLINEITNSDFNNIALYSFQNLNDIISTGNSIIESGYYEYSNAVVDGDNVASIVYTSGTTGNSKGVMLTHYNFCSSMYGACCNVYLDGPSLLILPLHHTFGLVAGVFSVLFYGHAICINSSLKRLVQDFKEYSPEHMFAVPLVVETLYKNIWNTAKKQGKDKTLKRAMCISNFLLRFRIDVRKRLFKSVISAFGENFKLIVSGGAPINDKYIKDFNSLGITVLNGYGITECGPIVAVNRNRYPVLGSVGPVLCCNDVKISNESEILVKGTNVMKGYYLNEKENNRSFTEDGWFKTGDIGNIDSNGILYITGRIKNLIILSNGENIPAESIENTVYSIPYVKEVTAYEKNNRIAVEVFLDESVTDAADKIESDIDKLNRSLPQNKNIGEIIIRTNPFPKTSTKKIKRNYQE